MTRTVAVDATVISRRLKGAGRVVRNLLAALPAVDHETRYLALAWPEGAAMLRQAGVQDVIETPDSGGLAWELRGLGRAAVREGADLIITVREVVGFGGPPTLMHVFEPPSYRLRGGRSWKAQAKDRVIVALFGGSLRRAAAVTAGSRSTADWIERRYGVHTLVVYPGIDPFFLERGTLAMSDLASPFFLHPVSGDPRENTDLVLNAFARAALLDVRLVTVGTPPALAARLRERAEELGVSSRVDVRGWVSDETLRNLYASALALLHPTRYEGFGGYPALEAMAQGTPVVALAAPGTSEALGEAALFIQGEDAEEMAAALRRLAREPDLPGNLSSLGRRRTATLTWESAAKAFVDVFQRVERDRQG
jgi:glycosyltransferase involved in cell wall biosynthesis